MPGGLALRPATRADVPTMLGLIRGIAEYERLSHEVEATEPLLRQHGFGPRRVFEAILAERDGGAVGFALYFFTFSTFTGRPTLYLEDLFVVPEERRGGIGSRLLTRLAQIAVERDCGRMEWSVLDWNSPARDLYFKLGAKSMDEWTVFRMTPEAFGRLAREGVTGGSSDEIARRWKVSKSEALRRAIRAVAGHGPEQSQDALQALDDLQDSFRATASTTRVWVQAARAERRASSRRREARAE